MITFLEFYNKRDNEPTRQAISPKLMTGMSVVHDYKSNNPISVPKSHPGLILPKKPALPTLLPYKQKFQDRPIESKPGDFLARKSSQK